MNLEALAKLLGIAHLPDYIAEVERAIEKLLLENNSPLLEPSLRLLKGSGKRLRPFLVIAAACSEQEDVDTRVVSGCAAIELAHIGALVHDDIIDDADTRWGVPTVSAVEGIDQAILVGDYFLAHAVAQAATISGDAALVLASTITQMCEGQSQETADCYNTERSVDSYLETIHHKTAALTSAACRIGALAAKLDDDQVQSLATYGEAFGMAFQLIDDLLDLLSTTKAMGKPVGNDIREGVYTLPVLLALQSSSASKVRELLQQKSLTKTDYAKLIDLLQSNGAFEATLKEIKKYNVKAVAALPKNTNAVVSGLAQLPKNYLAWALQKQSTLSLAS